MSGNAQAGNGAFGGVGRWLGLALIASLCVNLLIAGAVASSFWSLRQSGEGVQQANSGRGGQFARFMRTLPAERREAIRAAAANSRRTIAPLRQQARLAREEVNRQLAAEPFDKDKLAAAHLKEIEAESAVRRAVSQAMMDVAATMTAEERRSFALWREGRHSGGRGWRRTGAPNPQQQ